MRSFPKYTLGLFVLALILAASGAGWAQTRAGEYYYTGTLAGQPVQMDLAYTKTAISGMCACDIDGRDTKLKGQLGQGGAAEIGEYTANGSKTGAFSGTLSADQRHFSGTWRNADGSKTSSFTLNAVAEYIVLTQNAPRITIKGAYPHFFAATPALTEISRYMRSSIEAAERKFLRTGNESLRVLPKDITLFAEYQYALKYYSRNLLSSLETVTEYPGGAHPNTMYVSYNVQIVNGMAVPFGLTDLFKPGSNCINALSEYILNALRTRKAEWVTEGQITSFKASDLSTFYLRPTSITVVFDPYAVGPYVQGAFFIRVPYNHICANINPNGPLGYFMMTTP